MKNSILLIFFGNDLITETFKLKCNIESFSIGSILFRRLGLKCYEVNEMLEIKYAISADIAGKESFAREFMYDRETSKNTRNYVSTIIKKYYLDTSRMGFRKKNIVEEIKFKINNQ